MTSQEKDRRRTGFSGSGDAWPGGLFQNLEPAASDSRLAADADEESPVEAGVSDEVVASVEFSGVYIISVAARLLEMHPQTLRKYERVGLIRPSRTAGALRLYSDQDLERLRIVRRLAGELGLNLAGVRLLLEVVARLKLAVEEIDNDDAAAQSNGGTATRAHMKAVLEFVGA